MAVILRLRTDRDSVRSLEPTLRRQPGVEVSLALDATLARHPDARGYPLGATAGRRNSTAGIMDFIVERDDRDPLLEPGVNVLCVPGRDPAEVAAFVSQDPRVVHAYPAPLRLPQDATVPGDPADPYYPEQRAVKKCGFPAAWSKLEPDSATKPIDVAVIDTGYTPTHPDLPNPVLYETFGWSKKDKRGHGTCVSGILGAKRGNKYGLAGAAICDIWAFKVFDEVFSFDAYHRSLRVVALNDAIKVLNLSLGEAKPDPEEKKLIERCVAKGITVVAPIGNRPPDTGPIYPALYPSVIAVGATDDSDALAAFSIDSDEVDVAAPGARLITTSHGGTGYAWVDGTSFSAALVSAACVLIIRRLESAGPSPTAADVRAELVKNVALGTSGKGRGAGRIDLSHL